MTGDPERRRMADPTTSKLYLVIALFVLIILCLFSLDFIRSYVLDSVRSYVSGEGLYSKSQKDAVHHLQNYAGTGNELDYRKFQDAVAVPLGDRQAREALQAQEPDIELARAGFLQGGNHPDDVDRLISMFFWFQQFREMKAAIGFWEQADAGVAEMIDIAEKIRANITSPNPEPAKTKQLMQELDRVNAELTQLESGFSAVLGEGARRVKDLTAVLFIGATAVLLVVGIALSLQVVHGIRRTQQALAESEQRFRKVAESNMLGIAFMNTAGEILEANEAFCGMTGFSKQAVLGGAVNVRSVFSANSDAADAEAARQILAKGFCQPYEKTYVKRDGSSVVAYQGAAFLDDSRTQLVAFVLDVTEQRRLEAQLENAQKMDAIGTLVGGIAHDFNNTLTAIEGNLILARPFSLDNPPLVEKLDNIERLTAHSASIVHQLMTFARKDISQLDVQSVGDLFSEVMQLGPSILAEDIALTVTGLAEETYFAADSSQFQLIMVNLLKNAADAVDGRPDARIECRADIATPGSDLLARYPHLSPQPMARISVRDNGRGMTPSVLARIFEPFFTTKAVDEGTGLGMAMVYGAMQTHLGAVEVESSPGKGARVLLWFPICEVPAQAPSQPLSAADETPASAESILLVDDSPEILAVCAEFLRLGGHHVITAVDGVDGLARFQQNAQHIRLVISDIRMPNMGGIEFAGRLRLLQPRLPIIFITGYDPGQAAIPDALTSNSTLLTKPFSFALLEDQINALLGQQAAAARQGSSGAAD